MPSPSLYDSARLAAAYAYDRPPVHAVLVAAIGRRLARGTPAGRVLDVGCGAGRSTAALEALAHSVVGLEPVPAMLAHRREVAPRARFVMGCAEHLPFADRAFDLLTAAGSVNYADLGRFLPEARRVLTRDGVLVICDFSAGRRLAGEPGLEKWFASFERRYPFPPGYELDVRSLVFGTAGLRLDGYEDLEVALPMTFAQYLAYVLSETNVELAIARGVPEAAIRDWCRGSLHHLFAPGPLEVLFDAYAAYIRPI